jgi:hypothetical protein
MKEFKAERSYVDLNLAAFAANPDLRLVPRILRKYIKYRIMELRAAKWSDRQISTALGIKYRAVAGAIFKYEHFDVLYEDMRQEGN